MKMQQPQELKAELDDDGVAAFLAAHPDFFRRHTALLGQMNIPHDCGGAVSLLEYQAHVLRSANRELRTRLEELLAVARDNDRAAERLHRLTLELLCADGLESILFSLKDSLRSDFQADVVAVRLLVQAEHALAPELVERDHPDLALFAPTLQEQRAVCGPLTGIQLAYLFGDSGRGIASTALVPIVDEECLGLLAIGSRESERFQPGMGTVFLRQLGTLLGRALRERIPA
jgi:uncharacterized protein